jgi:hypothetical protein
MHPLLSNYRETINEATVVARQRPLTTTEKRFFSVRSVPRLYNEEQLRLLQSEGGITGPPCSWGK